MREAAGRERGEEWSIVLHILLHNHPQVTLKNAMETHGVPYIYQ
jgi:hypothetical protein